MKDNDQKIAEKLKKKKFSKIKTSVKNGIVYLDGEVNSWDEVIELGHAAGEMKEVKGVINNIIVKDVKEKKREKNLPKDTYNPHLP
ncbi:MAG: BON domain-containing protein, partial [Methanomicrobia archaeon]|nr:BON domain-containing protein [Methanomicrobia archaeon]